VEDDAPPGVSLSVPECCEASSRVPVEPEGPLLPPSSSWRGAPTPHPVPAVPVSA
jgi:hypothetical protein